jgi:hypothetical protein
MNVKLNGHVQAFADNEMFWKLPCSGLPIGVSNAPDEESKEGESSGCSYVQID